MSTTWCVPVGPYVKNAELAVRKMTGWKKDKEHPEDTAKGEVILTDGEFYVHCDIKPITIVDHGQFATIERWNQNYPMEETLEQIDGALSEHDDPTMVNCDNCGGYMMTNEMYTTRDGQSLVCRICYEKDALVHEKSETVKQAATTIGLPYKDVKKGRRK